LLASEKQAMEIYKTLQNKFEQELTTIKKKYNTISFLRLLSIVLFLISGYYYIKHQESMYAITAVLALVIFFILMQIHTKISFQKELKEVLIQINKNEISYLNREKIPFENGQKFNDFHHPYAYDLDVFGEHSLFQNLNRTNTFIGKKILAKQLLSLLPNDAILKNQEAVKELSKKLDWRQVFMALSKIGYDKQSVYETLIRWSRFSSQELPKFTLIISYVSPIVFGAISIAYFVMHNPILLSYLSFLFVFNLSVLGKYLKRIKLEIANAENIDKIIHQYSLLVQKIENEDFESQKLIELQEKLKFNNEKASVHLKQLSGLFSKMDSIANIVTAIVFNGSFLFNIHVLKALIDWKKNNAVALEHWLDVIGEIEMLNSLANFSYNNPDFAFPVLNTNFQIEFSDLSHPLLNPKTRVGNGVQFQPQSFMILTGSNMSGKSTFLRSLGINMVLAGIGAPVCARHAQVHPLPVLVSMRLSDSLSDSESYFFAEIKRLKQIMDELEGNPAFVLLDEILRGTNSDDKRNGTIEVVKKMVAKKAIGAIATHDIEVCLTTNDYPNELINKCFEVEISNNELHFDYQLRDGICKNRSATFLMQKMGVI
jgi:DNA mismatch repair ATPase MutS